MPDWLDQLQNKVSQVDARARDPFGEQQAPQQQQSLQAPQQQQPVAQAPPSLMEQAQQQFPLLRNHQIGYTENFNSGLPYHMESWKAGENAIDDRPRPPGLPLDAPGVEVMRRDARPIDIAGDIVSHHLINVDPVIKQHYNDFNASINPEQMNTLRNQYQYAKESLGENRPFEEWKRDSGIPSYFRGYAFDQYPKNKIANMYTPQQLTRFDQMMKYLRGSQ